LKWEELTIDDRIIDDLIADCRIDDWERINRQ